MKKIIALIVLLGSTAVFADTSVSFEFSQSMCDASRNDVVKRSYMNYQGGRSVTEYHQNGDVSRCDSSMASKASVKAFSFRQSQCDASRNDVVKRNIANRQNGATITEYHEGGDVSRCNKGV